MPSVCGTNRTVYTGLARTESRASVTKQVKLAVTHKELWFSWLEVLAERCSVCGSACCDVLLALTIKNLPL